MATNHEQARGSNGAYVDAGILPMLEAIWKLGIVTRFSCEGGLPHSEKAYITFRFYSDEDTAMIKRVFETTVASRRLGEYALVVKDDDWLMLEPKLKEKHLITFETPETNPEILIVRFPSSLTHELTRKFEELAAEHTHE